MKRRDFLSVTGASALAAAFSPLANAQAYPSKPIKFVVGFAPGGATDVVGRLMAKKIGDALGQPIII